MSFSADDFMSSAFLSRQFTIGFPRYLKSDGTRDMRVLKYIYDFAICPVLERSKRVMLYNSDIEELRGEKACDSWADLFLKKRGYSIFSDSDKLYKMVPEDFWLGEYMVPGDLNRVVYRGNVLATVSEDFSFEEVMRCSNSCYVVDNFWGAVGRPCKNMAIKIISENIFDTVVVFGSGRGSLSSMTLVPGIGVLERRINEAKKYSNWNMSWYLKE